jgi:ribosome-interacting GTPase 1
VARAIHKSLAAGCRGARVWGSSVRFAGQRVGRDHPVEDGDTVEVMT